MKYKVKSFKWSKFQIGLDNFKFNSPKLKNESKKEETPSQKRV